MDGIPPGLETLQRESHSRAGGRVNLEKLGVFGAEGNVSRRLPFNLYKNNL